MNVERMFRSSRFHQVVPSTLSRVSAFEMARRQGEVAEIRREHARAIKVRQDTVSHQRGELAKTIMQDVQRSKEMERTLRKAATADRQQKLEEARLRAQEDDGHALKRIEKSMSEQRLLNRSMLDLHGISFVG